MTARRACVALSALVAVCGIAEAEVLYGDVQVSTGGAANTIAYPNTSRNVAVAADGTIHVLFRNPSGIYVATSTNRGESFATPVQVEASSTEAEIAVDADGVVHVAWGAGSSVHYARSTDGGATFSPPTNIGAASGTVHMAVDAPYVYIINKRGTTLFRNDNNGDGAFSTVAIDSTRMFADVHVDPVTGDVYVQTDDPTVRIFKSTDFGVSFSGPHMPGGVIYYSTTVLASTDEGVFLYTSGSNTEALRIDVSDYSQTELTFGNTTISQGRTLAVDAYSNVIDGYVDGTDVKYAISEDNGATFGTAVTIAAGDYLSLGLSRRYGDIVAVYESGGEIYCTVYEGEITQPPSVDTSTVSGVTGTSATCGGEVIASGGDTVTARGVCWNTGGSPTTADNKTSDGTGTGVFTSSITGLTADTTYYVRAYATNSAGTAYGNVETFATAAAPEPEPTAPNLRVSVAASDQVANVGEELDFEIDVQNVGDGDATEVVLRFPLPAGTAFVGAWLVQEQAGQSLALDAHVENDEIVVALGDVAAAAGMKLALKLKATTAGAVALEASVACSEQPAPATAQANANVEVDDVYYEVVQRAVPINACGVFGVVSPMVVTLGLLALRRRGGRV